MDTLQKLSFETLVFDPAVLLLLKGDNKFRYNRPPVLFYNPYRTFWSLPQIYLLA